MTVISEVRVYPRPLDRFAEVLDAEHFTALLATADRARAVLAGRTVWCVNSTAAGGGVAEMLAPLLGYTLGVGVPARWAVLGATGVLHDHQAPPPPAARDAGRRGAARAEEHAAYEATLERNAADLVELVSPGDIVLLHDPQTAGLTEALVDHGAAVVWRAHIGVDEPQRPGRKAWAFLFGYVSRAHAYVFSRGAYVWDTLDPARCHVIAPSIDAFSPKNQELGAAATTRSCTRPDWSRTRPRGRRRSGARRARPRPCTAAPS